MLCALLCSTLLLATDAPATLPLPAVDGHAAQAPRKRVLLPLPFDAVVRFYRVRFSGAAGVTWAVAGGAGARVLTLRSTRETDAWAMAVVEETPQGTHIRITPMYRLEATRIPGLPPPYVHLVMPRAPDAAQSARDIDHLDLGPRRH